LIKSHSFLVPIVLIGMGKELEDGSVTYNVIEIADLF